MKALKYISSYILLLFLFTSILFILNSCNEETIVIPDRCSEEPDFGFLKARLVITTEIVSETYLSVHRNGYFYGDSIKLQYNNSFRNAFIDGLVCKDRKASLEVKYNDTLDNSRLRIEAEPNIYNQINGKLLYCSDINSCSFTEIGTVTGFMADYFGGFFTSPLFNGEFKIYPVYN